MSLIVNGLLAVVGWTTLVLLSYGPGPMPTVALIVALALLVGCVASLLLAAVWYAAVRRSFSDADCAAQRPGRAGRPRRP